MKTTQYHKQRQMLRTNNGTKYITVTPEDTDHIAYFILEHGRLKPTPTTSSILNRKTIRAITSSNTKKLIKQMSTNTTKIIAVHGTKYTLQKL